MTKKDNFNFKKAFEELEQINEWFSNQDIDIDEGLKRFRRGMEIVKDAKERLKEVENEFEEIKKDLEVEENKNE